MAVQNEVKYELTRDGAQDGAICIFSDEALQENPAQTLLRDRVTTKFEAQKKVALFMSTEQLQSLRDKYASNDETGVMEILRAKFMEKFVMDFDAIRDSAADSAAFANLLRQKIDQVNRSPELGVALSSSLLGVLRGMGYDVFVGADGKAAVEGKPALRDTIQAVVEGQLDKNLLQNALVMQSSRVGSFVAAGVKADGVTENSPGTLDTPKYIAFLKEQTYEDLFKTGFSEENIRKVPNRADRNLLLSTLAAQAFTPSVDLLRTHAQQVQEVAQRLSELNIVAKAGKNPKRSIAEMTSDVIRDPFGALGNIISEAGPLGALGIIGSIIYFMFTEPKLVFGTIAVQGVLKGTGLADKVADGTQEFLTGSNAAPQAARELPTTVLLSYSAMHANQFIAGTNTVAARNPDFSDAEFERTFLDLYSTPEFMDANLNAIRAVNRDPQKAMPFFASLPKVGGMPGARYFANHRAAALAICDEIGRLVTPADLGKTVAERLGAPGSILSMRNIMSLSGAAFTSAVSSLSASSANTTALVQDWVTRYGSPNQVALMNQVMSTMGASPTGAPATTPAAVPGAQPAPAAPQQGQAAPTNAPRTRFNIQLHGAVIDRMERRYANLTPAAVNQYARAVVNADWGVKTVQDARIAMNPVLFATGAGVVLPAAIPADFLIAILDDDPSIQPTEKLNDVFGRSMI